MTAIRIKVTEDDIAEAHRGDSYICVVSRAIARQIPQACRIDTDLQTIRFTRTDTGERLAYLTPYTVQGYIVAYDAGDPILPFTFLLRNPQRIQRKLRTEKGKAQDKARGQAVRDATKKSGASATAKTDVSIKDAYARATAEAGSGPSRTNVGEGHRPPPRLHKKRQRTYGHRVLRINQMRAATDA